jgi:precorrin-6x reductase
MLFSYEDVCWAIITHVLYPSIIRPLWEQEYKNVSEISQIAKVAALAKVKNHKIFLN